VVFSETIVDSWKWIFCTHDSALGETLANGLKAMLYLWSITLLLISMMSFVNCNYKRQARLIFCWDLRTFHTRGPTPMTYSKLVLLLWSELAAAGYLRQGSSANY